PAPAATEASAPPSRARRLGAELAGASLAVGATVGLTAGVARAFLRGCNDDELFGFIDQCAWNASMAIVNIGAFAATPIAALGVWSGGSLAGGQGRYDFTLLGGALGNALGWVALAGLARSDSDAAFGVGMALLPLLQVAGAMIGYELSHRAESGRDRRVGPTFSADRNGGTLGIAGVF
ncbi:MAG TPA: hypothetical protein RMI62_13660, partial [Polyangiaceae bacterium LLY-WYZ-15_(1-7)]|nr:hypothetical protein [Polyangiaceae bacterium LLY-WYZ-15_(1-7)]